MRTTSSLKVVLELAPPWNSAFPCPSTVLFAGKMPAPTRAAELGLIMQEGMMLPGNCAPPTIPAGAVLPGQLAKRTLPATWAFDPVQAPTGVPGPQNVGTKMGLGVFRESRELKSPP